MEISAIGASIGTPRAASDRGLGSLKSADFLKILVTELQNQDPFEPTKTADMISQVSQIRSIELSGKLTDTLDLLTDQQRIGGATGGQSSTLALLGKYVQAITIADDGSEVLRSGVVTGVAFSSDGLAVLELDTGEAVMATDVVRVTTLAETDGDPKVQLWGSDADEDDGQGRGGQS